ncbi:MAG: hypothetical protein OXB89_04250 [Anaerolineaceae bacterium]|nr:hypothetical protein [Anaerolineaceae bacterium]
MPARAASTCSDFPHHQFGLVLTQAFNNPVWSVTGRNEDESWAQPDIDGEPAWVNARFMNAPQHELAPVALAG